jgi:hypothetical protein
MNVGSPVTLPTGKHTIRTPEATATNLYSMQMSYSRGRTDPEHVAYVAHNVFAQRDSNRYRINRETGDNEFDADGYYPEADGGQDRSVPISQLVHEGSKVNLKSC